MLLYSLNGEYPVKIPERLRLPNGATRTDSATYSATEIELAGYVPVEIPEYDPITEQIVWLGDRFVVNQIPTPDPLPDWDAFNLQMMSNIRFNQVYGQCLQIAPIVASALPTALAQVATHGNNLFSLVFNQICLLGGATQVDRNNWKEVALSCNLPTDFVEIF